MYEVNLRQADFVELSTEILGKGGFLRFKAYGSSMFPFIRDGDTLTVQPVEAAALNVGDMVFYHAAGKQMIVHRVVGRRIHGEQVVLMIRGDATSGPDEQIQPKQVLGRVVSVQRGEKVFRFNQGTQRLAGLVWLRGTFWGLLLIRLVKIVKQLPDRFLKLVVGVRSFMALRILLGRLLIRLGGFIQSLAVAVMRPDDLVEFSRQMYARPGNIESWGEQDLVDWGLNPDEKALLEKIDLQEGCLLLLGVGGGREAIPLVQRGFEVTGVDFVPEMVEKAKENVSPRGIHIKGIVQEFSKLDVPASSYDIVWISQLMYSCVPTRKRRIEMLKRIRKALKSGGYFVCQFHWNPKRRLRKGELVRKTFAFFTLGNLWYEKGDMLWGNVEFIHAFSSEEELRTEFEEAGFEVLYAYFSEKNVNGGAVLKKPSSA